MNGARAGSRSPQPDESAADRVVDVGLQNERTFLAWHRTGLSFAGVGALLAHTGQAGDHPLREIPGLVVMALGLSLFYVARRRYRRVTAHVRAGEPLLDSGDLRRVGLFSATTAVLAVTLVLLVP